MEEKKYVCSSTISWTLDNFVRKWIHNPYKIFGKYLKKSMVILDIGCGPGFFTESFAEMTGNNGKVIAADLQEEMLEIVSNKIKGKKIENTVLLHKCGKNSIGLNAKVDFVNAFYMVHEVPDSNKLLNEIYSILEEGGIFFLSEPKFHVSKKEFDKTVMLAENTGFKIIGRPRLHMSRTAVFSKN